MNNKVQLVLRIVVAVILVQTLRFKFTAHPDSVYIFSQVGLEPIGRIGIGVMELIAAILILVPRTVWLGAMLVIGILGGAIMMHLTSLGIEVKGDGGLLFYTAIATVLMSAYILFSEKHNVLIIQKIFR